MFGQAQFAAENRLVNEVLARVGTMIVSHRGVGYASLAENSALAVRAAVLSGSDMVELDVTSSRDGEFFGFHDGYELELLGFEKNLQTLTAGEVDKASHVWIDRPGRQARVERLLPLLESFRGSGVLLQLDRSWWRWPQLLRAAATLKMSDQLVMKCPAWEEAALERLREFPTKYPLIPICSSPDDVYRTVGDPQLNTVGVELITTTERSPWFCDSVIEEFHDLGVFSLVSTVTLTTGVPLFGGLDDELAVADSPDTAWGPIFELGIDAIQTDWPWLLRDYRELRRAMTKPLLDEDLATPDAGATGRS
ncbi:MAG: glycerophosphodiester phosphodiesterase family protein [Propionicimonas sp.]|uniref:glycerophosphodiester phosphodiesterase family protein n=1 Tax=Propionicimonas sp. TaxID=1955623 RepID=UPI002B22010B|nr:glycerophosphodiester phosphodiesterase family protein [Propionicimonas sp.]MEA4945413.1 glycerophosphodiester phosphodiesterase family protein [Propionicimonas sp.]MEA5116322.1 glycerophosphodiester phosphodiesterase family protein [Propionicimonas sp.]